jgi:glycine cleavage system H protein
MSTAIDFRVSVSPRPVGRTNCMGRVSCRGLSPDYDASTLSKESAAMASPSDRRFSESHEWFQPQGDLVTVGITQFAANELTDITYVELKPTGTNIKPGSPVGEVESVKTTSDIYSVIGGSIAEINKAAVDDPSLLNSDPYGKGWLVKIRTTDASPLSKLMDQATYDRKNPVG